MAHLVVSPGARPVLGTGRLSRRLTKSLAGATQAHVVPEPDADPRTLAAHVRVLEAALEEQVRRVAELTEELEAVRARPHEDVRRMSATVEGLRVAFGKDPVAQRLLARIDAALDRLVEPGELVRVPLPEQPPAAGRTATAPAPTQVNAATDDAATSRPDAPAGPLAPRVAPIPATEPDPAPQRRRGRRA